MSKKTRKSSRSPMPARDVINACGGNPVVFKALGIGRQSLHQWLVIPATRVADLERLSGIPREKIRPDVFRDSDLPKDAGKAA